MLAADGDREAEEDKAVRDVDKEGQGEVAVEVWQGVVREDSAFVRSVDIASHMKEVCPASRKNALPAARRWFENSKRRQGYVAVFQIGETSVCSSKIISIKGGTSYA